MDIISQLTENLRQREADIARIKQAIEVLRQGMTPPVQPPVATVAPAPTPTPTPTPAPVPARPQPIQKQVQQTLPQKPAQQLPQSRTRPDLRRPIMLGYAIAKWLEYMGRPMSTRSVVDGLAECGYEWSGSMNVSDRLRAIRGSVKHYSRVFEGPNFRTGGRISLRESVDIEQIPIRSNTNYLNVFGTTLPEKVAEAVNAHGSAISAIDIADKIAADYPLVKHGSISSAVCTAIKKGLIKQVGLMQIPGSNSRARLSVIAPLDYSEAVAKGPEAGKSQPEAKHQQTTRDAVRAALEAAGYPMTTAGVVELLQSTGHDFHGTDPRIAVSSALSNTVGVSRIGYIQHGNAQKFVWALSKSQFASQPWQEFNMNEDGNPVPFKNNGHHQQEAR